MVSLLCPVKIHQGRYVSVIELPLFTLTEDQDVQDVLSLRRPWDSLDLLPQLPNALLLLFVRRERAREDEDLEPPIRREEVLYFPRPRVCKAHHRAWIDALANNQG
jgi:hypothetical protein